jgi:hypothetical protein
MGSPINDENDVTFLMRSMFASYRGLLVALKGQLPNMTLQTLITLREETLMKSLSPSSNTTTALFIGKKLASKHKNAFGSKTLKEGEGPSNVIVSTWKKKLQCIYCKKLGHVQKNCNKKLTTLEAENQNNITSITSTSKLLFVVAFISKIRDNSWLMDMGATEHMAFDHKCFVTYTKCGEKQFVYLGHNFAHEIVGKGNVLIILLNGEI